MVTAVGAIAITLLCAYLLLRFFALIYMVWALGDFQKSDWLYFAFWAMIALIALCFWWALVGSRITIGFN